MRWIYAMEYRKAVGSNERHVHTITRTDLKSTMLTRGKKKKQNKIYSYHLWK